MGSLGRSGAIAATLLGLLAGGAALAYARWMAPIAVGDAALDRGDLDAAFAAYRTAETRFDGLPPLKGFFSADYDRVVTNELWILFAEQSYELVIEKAERAPAGAAPHFWAGAALFRRARGEEKPELRLDWLGRAEEEFRKAVEAAPNDWDTKFDFELTARLVAELRNQPKVPLDDLMPLLRPQPAAGNRPIRRVG